MLPLTRLCELTPLERHAVEQVLLNGREYATVGATKSVDNAIQRARRKLKATPADIPAPQSRVVLVDRNVHQTAEQGIEEARSVAGGGTVVAITPRKLLDGRDKAPQGRPNRRGRTGQPVWRVELRAAA